VTRSGTCNSGGIGFKGIAYDGVGVGDGNISSKSDVGGYTYGGNGGGPHAVSAIDTTSTGGCTLASCTFDSPAPACSTTTMET
jgi:hypothetical protein